MAKTPDFKITKTIPDLIAESRKPGILPETGWWRVGASEGHEVEFEDTWDNVGVLAGITNAPASWYLSEGGEVRLRGKVGGGADNTTIFTLPEEVRPEYTETFVVPVDNDGNIDLSGIKYRAHQRGDV